MVKLYFSRDERKGEIAEVAEKRESYNSGVTLCLKVDIDIDTTKLIIFASSELLRLYL